jgi:thiol-disulfide isomerase/thioredoxin
VSVDINSNRPLVEVYKVDTAKGVPYLTILDAAGKVVTGQETGVLEAGSKHDPARVLAFLKKQKAEPDDAAEIVKQAEVQAGRESKAVFLRFGAPWCKWCHKLDDYLYQPAVATVLRKHFVLVKVDMDRMKNAKEVAARFRSQASGIPWFAMLDARGEKLITSDAAQGNIGYPTADAEVAHFRSMLARAGSGMTPGEIDGLVAALQEHGRAKATR